MNMDKELFQRFAKARGLAPQTQQQYKYRLNRYTEFQEKTLQELLEEAEQEEEQGVRWKNRTLKKRLLDYRIYLQDTYLEKTIAPYMDVVLTFYRFYDIEIHNLPPLNKKALKKPEPITFKDLPDKDIIQASLNIATPLMKAIILFISSSGCARTETMNLTIQDFIDATYEYHQKTDIYEIIEKLEGKKDIIPTWHILRQKTKKHYYTFCSPEAVEAIISYLLSRNDTLDGEKQLFKIDKFYFLTKFKEINECLGLGKKGTYNRFRSHMLRKFHASQLYNDGVSLELVDALQGRGKDSTHSSYFMEDPERLRDIYVEHMNAVTINLDVNNLDLKSPEYVALEAKYEDEKRTNEENSLRINELESKINNITNSLMNKI